MKRKNLPTIVLFIIGAALYIALSVMGYSTIGVTAFILMLVSYTAGLMQSHAIRPQVYKLSDDELKDIVDDIDDTAGLMVKASTIKYEIERAVNNDRGTTTEWTMQEIRKGTEARRNAKSERRS